jgi:hypothetical protein
MVTRRALSISKILQRWLVEISLCLDWGGAISLPGVNIGDDALIGAGSVVTRDVPAGATAFDNPARVRA